MKNSPGRDGSAGARRASAEPPAPWLGILKTCLYWTVGASLAAMVVAAFAGGAEAAFSVGLASLLVIAFFAVGLLVADWVGRVSPGAALGAFIITYLVKVFGIGFILLAIGMPAWVEQGWFMWTAIGVVVLWQAGEIRAFSKARLPLYASSGDSSTTTEKAGE